ncbi:hypothetical protein NWP21_13370 [Anabaenopsis sp. FSS-46]|uniref:hypothetical protein n=1 Tax=Nostocales TaxID=1161 RepID=UPI00232AA089|nr:MULTISPECIES: hypothetical protein [Nostocales]MDH6099810.1 hypothetical protein [Anabaenopsis sp. FSS-46]
MTPKPFNYAVERSPPRRSTTRAHCCSSTGVNVNTQNHTNQQIAGEKSSCQLTRKLDR